MPDNFNSAFLATRQGREKATLDKMVAEDSAWVTANQPAPAPSAAPTAPPKKTSSPGVVSETLKAVGGGAVDAARNAWNTIDDAATWLDNNFLDLRIGSQSFGQVGGAKAAGNVHKEGLQIPALPDWAQNKTTGGQIARSATQFLVPFLGAAKALKAVQVGNAAIRGTAAGAATDFAAFDPHEKRLSNMVMEFSNENPAIGKPLFQYLAADPSDTNMEGRLKNTLEGLGLGLATEGLIKGVKAAKAHFTAKGVDPAQAIQEAARAPAEDLTAHAVDTSPAPNTATRDAVNAATGVKEPGADKWQKRLDVKAATDAEAVKASTEDLTGNAISTGKAPDVSLADQIDLITGVKRDTPSKFQKSLDMKAALEAEAAAKKAGGIDYTPTKAPEAAPTGPELASKDGIPYTKEAPLAEIPVSEHLKLVEQDPSPRKLFLDQESGSLVMANEAKGPKQLDLDLALPDVLKKTEHTPEERTLLEGVKELQDKALEKAPGAAEEATLKASTGADLEARVARAQSRVDALVAEGRDTETAQKVLDNLLKKKDAGLFEQGSKLTSKEADQLASSGDPLVASINDNNDKLLRAFGKQQGGFISPSALANLVSAQAGAVTGFMSAEDDATFAERLSLAGMGAVAGLGLKVGASKVLKTHERPLVDNPHPVVKELARPELRNIAPISATAKPQPVIRMGGIQRIAQAIEGGNLDQVAREAKNDAFNFSRIDSDADVNELFNATEAAFQQEIDKARGGASVSFDQIREMADMTGGGMKSLEELYQGTGGLASRFYAHRAMLVASAEKVVELAKMAREGKSFDIIAANKQLKLHAIIQAKVNGVQTEIARAMAAMRLTAGSADFALNEANSLVESLGGHNAQIKFMSDLADITTPEGLNQAVRMGAMARTRSALVESATMGKLWSPVTHVANFTSNLLVAVSTIAEKAGAAALGTIMRNPEDVIKAGEVKSQVFGMMGGLYDALKITKQGREAIVDAGKEALQGNFRNAVDVISGASDEFGSAYAAGVLGAPTGRSTMHMTMDSNMESRAAITASNFNLDPDEFFGKFVDGLGTLTRLPGHALAFGDEVFWTMQYRGELRAQAYRKATQEGLDGHDLVSRVADLISNPTPDIRGFAVKAAEDGTFTAPLGAFGQSATAWVDKMNIGALPVGRLIVPFVRTPANIMRYAFERTPLAPLSAQVREELVAGGARRDLAVSKMVIGSSLLTMATVMAAGMDINGTEVQLIGGGDLKKSSDRLGGIQAYSVKIGDTYYAFNRMDPLGMFLGLAADFKDIMGHLDERRANELTTAAVLSLSRNLGSKSYLKGLTDLTDAFGEAGKGNLAPLNQYFLNQGAGMMPFQTAFNTARKETDDVSRSVWDMMDAVKNKLPGFSEDVPPVRNLFGEEVKLKGGLGPDIMSPVSTSEATSEPAAKEISRLNLDLKAPPRSLSAAPGAPAIDLDKWQYDKLSKMAGENFKQAVSSIISDERYKTLTEGDDHFMDGKEKVLKDAHSRASMQAVRQLLEEDPPLKEQWYATRQKASSALTGQAPLQ